MAERIEFSGEIEFASERTPGVRDFTPNLVKSLSDGIGFNPKVDISVPLACDRMWYFRKIGIDSRSTSEDRYLYTVAEIKSAGSKRILQEKLTRFGKPLELIDLDLGVKSRIDCVYSYQEEDQETGQIYTLDQLVCIKFVPYFVLKQLKAESDLNSDVRKLLVWNMGVASNTLTPEGRELDIVGANLLYVSVDGGKNSRGMQLERKLPWNGQTLREFITLVGYLEDLNKRIGEGKIPVANPTNSLICRNFCQYWRRCDYGSQVVDNTREYDRRPIRRKKPRVKISENQMSFDLRAGDEIKVENTREANSSVRVCFDCGANMVKQGVNGSTKYVCPNCGG
ncbi:MAG: hypothetical protein HY044_04875 [Candidatus Woesebacteria bacterium]|nr:MAG: hypothetical protein HY044_04875 [Candidatus Woesebacteria bacterium]